MNGLILIYFNQSNNLLDKECDTLNEVKLRVYKAKSAYQNEILNYYDHKYLLGCCRCDADVIKITDEFKIEIQIFIKTIDDKILTFGMEHSNKIRDLKMKIQEKTKLSAAQQNLFFQGEILNDDERTIDEYEICEKSVIDIVAQLRGGMQIFAKTMCGKIVAFEIQKSDNIICIKKIIHEKIGFHPDEQILIYQGEILENDKKTIDEYGICEKSMINVVDKFGNKGMQLFAKKMDGRTVSIEVQKSDKIIDLKCKIQEKLVMHPDEQILVYQGGIMDDDKTIDECGICDKYVINVVEKSRNKMQIFAKTIDGKIFAFQVQKSDKIIDIKYKIQEKIGMLPDEQKLVYQGGMLNDDNKTIDECQIAEKSVINVVLKLRVEIQIFAKTMNGKTVSIEAYKSDKIIDIKYKIQHKTGLHRDEQRLIYQNKILDDDNKTIDEYQICEKSVINVVA